MHSRHSVLAFTGTGWHGAADLRTAPNIRISGDPATPALPRSGVACRASGGLDPGYLGGEEVDAVAVKVAAGSVVVLGGAWVGMAGEDLGVAEWDAGVEGVGDRGVPQ